MASLCVLGLGYIGLPVAALAASSGMDVVGVDIDPGIVDTLSQGLMHISEPDLGTLVARVVSERTLRVQTTHTQSDVFLIAVPTPVNHDKTADLSFVESAVRSIVPYLQKGNLVVVESTIPPGTTDGLICSILQECGLRVGIDVFLAYCPERVLPGRILAELVDNDRVVGGVNEESSVMARDFYVRFVRGTVHIDTAITAEMVKLVENAYRDANIAFANEPSLLCDRLVTNVWNVIDIANRHPRVNILSPGPGVGGHCIAVDPWFLVEKAPGITPLIRTARQVNDSMPEHVVRRVEAVVPSGAKVACLGVSYKANVGDTRESPAIEVVELLTKRGYSVLAVDPHVAEHRGVSFASLEEALNWAECVVLLVDHHEFRLVDAAALAARIGASRIIDTRGVWLRRHRSVSDLPWESGSVASKVIVSG